MCHILGHNKIKSLNGGAFTELKKLNDVRLIGNECIDRNFQGSKEVEVLAVVLQNKCGAHRNVLAISEDDF